jgi:acyl phosphate:glycerol-3-phosphate acyltransferase
MVAAGILVLAFVVGAIPVSNLLATRARGVDLRGTGSGTVSGTSLYRVAGFRWLVVGGILDVCKGAVCPLLAGGGLAGAGIGGVERPVAAALAGGLAVAGHNWSPFLRGHGGRGVGPALGALLVNAWPGVVVLVVCLLVARAFRETGIGGFVGEALLTPVVAITNGPVGALAGGAVAVPMLAKRVVGNTRPAERGWRVYAHRLLFDHDPPQADATAS